jgi:hypothetical protein
MNVRPDFSAAPGQLTISLSEAGSGLQAKDAGARSTAFQKVTMALL